MSHPDLASTTPESLVDDVRIASPCKASWDDMVGDDRVRFCGQCSKNVYNLSALSRDAAEALLREAGARNAANGDGMCVRLYRRADGTVLTADCPDGARRKRRRLALFSAVGGGLMAAGAAVAAAELPRPAPMQGAVATTFQGGPVMGAPLATVDPAPIATQPATTETAQPTPTDLVAVPPPTPIVAPPVPKKHGHWTGGAISRPVPPAVPLMGDISMPVQVMGKIKQ
jgi:hypothetical protein